MEQLPQVFLADHALYLETGSSFLVIDASSAYRLLDYLESHLISSHDKDEENTIENLTNQLKTTLTAGVSRKHANEWRHRWFRVYALRGHL